MTKFVPTLASLFLLIACSPAEKITETTGLLANKTESLTVYKDPNCGCCKDWISHVNEYGYVTKTIHPKDMWAVKQQLNIGNNLQSCHSAVTDNGFVFEGHVPAKFIEQFLANPVDGAIGLTVPAMVVGSPGMEVGDKFKAYKIWLMLDDGSSQLYQAIDSYQQQF